MFVERAGQGAAVERSTAEVDRDVHQGIVHRNHTVAIPRGRRRKQRGQRSTDKPHYDQVMDELQMLGQRNLLCGLHVHVQPAQQESRIGLLSRLQPFLPLLLDKSGFDHLFWQLGLEWNFYQI